MKVLVTCPPMLKRIDSFRNFFQERNVDITTPDIIQTLSEEELIKLLPEFDGWIIGDDPATKRVFEAGKSGKLKAAVKWGVGVDNVDFSACKELNIPISNTPGMFGNEVADVAVGYVIGLARHLFEIHDGTKKGEWKKPAGISLSGKQVALVGFGDIGKNVFKRLVTFGMNVTVYDPFYKEDLNLKPTKTSSWPNDLEECDFIVFTCALTKSNFHMFNGETLKNLKKGVRIVNVARGGLIDESALIVGLKQSIIHSVALDVFEIEPLPQTSELRLFEGRIIYGSHNGSNTIDAVERASHEAIKLLFGFLGIK